MTKSIIIRLRAHLGAVALATILITAEQLHAAEVSGAAAPAPGVAKAGATGATAETSLAAWWNGKRATYDWFGARTLLEDNGLTLTGGWRGIYFGVVSGENGSGNAFTQELVFAGRLDFAKLSRLEGLNGLSAFGEVRWREPGSAANPNNIIGGSSLFNPSRYAGGVGWRMMNFGLTYTTPELFGVDKLLTVTGGWLQPQKEFIEQPLAKLFANNAMASAEGLGGNIPFSSSFSTWGGTLEVKPVDWYYAKAGLFLSYPDPTNPRNNGLMFEGIPGENGLFAIGETGVTPAIGSAKLPGRYAFGGYYYGEDNEQYGSSKYGFYWQADQMIYREGGAGAGKLSEQGLRAFSLFSFAPQYNNRYPFYFHSGLVYEGLVPQRDKDQLIVGLAFAQYSHGTLLKARAAGKPEPTTTSFLEAGYRVKINGWAFAQPFAQYVVQPNGTDAVANAAILGVFMGVDF